ncbi:MAG: hypothetical protein ABI417_07190 [Coleofasciculaceae cyanobacterium]
MWANIPTTPEPCSENTVLATEAAQSPVPVAYELVEADRQTNLLGERLYEVYKPQRITIHGVKPHPITLCESAALSSVKPAAVTYKCH